MPAVPLGDQALPAQPVVPRPLRLAWSHEPPDRWSSRYGPSSEQRAPAAVYDRFGQRISIRIGELETRRDVHDGLLTALLRRSRPDARAVWLASAGLKALELRQSAGRSVPAPARRRCKGEGDAAQLDAEIRRLAARPDLSRAERARLSELRKAYVDETDKRDLTRARACIARAFPAYPRFEELAEAIGAEGRKSRASESIPARKAPVPLRRTAPKTP